MLTTRVSAGFYFPEIRYLRAHSHFGFGSKCDPTPSLTEKRDGAGHGQAFSPAFLGVGSPRGGGTTPIPTAERPATELQRCKRLSRERSIPWKGIFFVQLIDWASDYQNP